MEYPLKYDLLLDRPLVTECGTTLYPIRAKRDLTHPALGLVAKQGELGGYIANQSVLSHEGNAWVSTQAQVFDGVVKDDALISGYARMYGGLLCDSAIVSDCAVLSGNPHVGNQSAIVHNAKVKGTARVLGKSVMMNDSLAEDDALLINATLKHKAQVVVGGEVRDAVIQGDFIVHNGGTNGQDKGEALAHRYGCSHHADNYEAEVAHYNRYNRWKKYPFLQNLLHKWFGGLVGRKYKLLPHDSIQIGSHVLYRIQALRPLDEHNVRRGDLGGYIESESNLSHFQGAWVGGNAKVYGKKEAGGGTFFSPVVAGCALVTGNAVVTENVVLSHQCVVQDNAVVKGTASLLDQARICGEAHIEGEDIVITGKAVIKDKAQVSGRAQIHDESVISGSAKLKDFAQCRGKTSISHLNVVFSPLPRDTILF